MSCLSLSLLLSAEVCCRQRTLQARRLHCRAQTRRVRPQEPKYVPKIRVDAVPVSTSMPQRQTVAEAQRASFSPAEWGDASFDKSESPGKQ